MSLTGRRWLAVLAAAAAYFLVGRLFSLPAGHQQAWRLAAWLVSGLIFAAHFTWARFRLHATTARVALDVASAVGLGALALAVAGMVHSLVTTGTVRLVWLLALVLWPVLTALPAWLVAFTAGMVLDRLRPTVAARPHP